MKTVYFEKVKHLLGEVFKVKKLKAMNPALAVLSCIVLAPFMLLFFLFAGLLLVNVIVFEILETPAKYLHEFLHKEGQEVKHGTQVIVYLISWPVVFGLKALIAFVTLTMNALYVLTVMTGWMWTLGGFKFHLSILEEGYELEEQDRITKGRPLTLVITGLITGIIGGLSYIVAFLNLILVLTVQGLQFKLINYILFLVTGTPATAENIASVEASLATPIANALTIAGLGLLSVYGLFVLIFVPVAFHNRAKAVAAPEKKAK